MTISEAVSEAHETLRHGVMLSDTALQRLLNGIADSECALAEAKKDTARLDWITGLDCDSYEWLALADSVNLRAAIDAARGGKYANKSNPALTDAGEI